MLNQIEEFSNEDFTFVAHGLFFTTPDMAAVAAFDERSDLLNGFALYLDDTLKPSLNARAGAITKTTFRRVTEDKMQTNVTRGFGMETDESATGRFGDDALDTLDLFEDEDGDVSYAGAAGTHNADGLDLMPMPWGPSPASGPTKDPSVQRNAQNARAQRSGDGEDNLDLMPLW